MSEPTDVRPFVARNISLLALMQAIVGSNQAIIMAVGALTAASLAPDKSMATLPTTFMILGLALMAAPATKIIYALGRRNGFMLGASIGIIAGFIAGLAVYLGSFWLFAIALAVVGASAAFGQQIRFAIADSVPENIQAKAISWVLLGGVAAGFLGPRLSYITKDWVGDVEFTGSFLIIAVLSALGVLILSQTKLAPVRVKREEDPVGRTARELIRVPEIFIPLATGMATYALMTFVMVAAPLAMVHVCGHSPEAATTTIQWHIISMFLPSLFTGSIITRIGSHAVVGIGMLLMLGCALINLNGTSTLHFDIALILLGVGWNFGFIGSTTMLAKAYRPEEASTAQALNEPLVFGTMAIASISSGFLLENIGWESINVMVLPVATAALALLAWGDLRQRKAKRA
ncbi:putative MFS family arabinose efflux permease [Maritalea mobilis]|uniref:Putative MFS family arabinose efflux permease n=1 Tax=Maritalea mobilis TaxID=483324 RepID=A0A4R6VQB5_9HYPH|nr:MFS transporter [Maritalea mobilis]TDQ66142.1 putative MFS family arabinose efflux permease [Maritalea mobilis]